jgi:hypothetical protein
MNGSDGVFERRMGGRVWWTGGGMGRRGGCVSRMLKQKLRRRLRD